jgi:hypothetical protein
LNASGSSIFRDSIFRQIDDVASGRLSVVDRPDRRVQAFQEKMRRPVTEQREKQLAADCMDRMERERLRQEQKRRAAGIPATGSAGRTG